MKLKTSICSKERRRLKMMNNIIFVLITKRYKDVPINKGISLQMKAYPNEKPRNQKKPDCCIKTMGVVITKEAMMKIGFIVIKNNTELFL